MANQDINDYAHSLIEQEHSHRDAQNRQALADRIAHEHDVRSFADLPVRERPHQDVHHGWNDEQVGHSPKSVVGSDFETSQTGRAHTHKR